MTRRNVCSLFVLAACSMLASPAAAYNANGRLWGSQQIVFNYNDASFGGPLANFTSVRNHLQSATFTWTQPGCTILSMTLGSSTTTRYEAPNAAGDGESVLYYETDINAWNALMNDDTVYAETFYHTDPPLTGTNTVDADIVFNGTGMSDGANPTDWGLDGTDPTKIDFETVALHEMGHALGLDHNDAPGASIMNSVLHAGTIRRSLRQDDIDAVCALYPNPFAMAGMSAECTTDHDCATGTCALIGTTHTCQYRCGGDCDCPTGNTCTATATTGVSVCQTGTNSCPPSTGTPPAQNGATCVHSSDCVSLLCYAPATGSHYCTRRCGTDCDCNAGYACDATSGLCLMSTGPTHCMPPDAGARDAGATHGDGGAAAPPPSHGGCVVAPRGNGALVWLGALGLAFVARRRIVRR